ncbi:MAG TPA: hypothetical protein VKT30_12700 [Caulobacteraceae bacterium]|nr:hypothetical protein [Caulobacteraceae bacterium]
MQAPQVALLSVSLAFGLALAAAGAAQACGPGEHEHGSGEHRHHNDRGRSEPDSWMSQEGTPHTGEGRPYYHRDPERDREWQEWHRYNNLPWYQQMWEGTPKYHEHENAAIRG